MVSKLLYFHLKTPCKASGGVFGLFGNTETFYGVSVGHHSAPHRALVGFGKGIFNVFEIIFRCENNKNLAF